jgi:nicotinamide-nucleotide amidase
MAACSHPGVEIARSLRRDRADGIPIDSSRSRPCLRAWRFEIATVFEPPYLGLYDQFEAAIRERHARHAVLRGRLDRRATSDRAAWPGWTVAGRVLHRPAEERAAASVGSSEYMLGGVVAYSNAAKIALADVPRS